MAMLNVQQNLASELQALAVEYLKLKNRTAVAVAMWQAEGMGSLTDADWAELTEFAHVTAQEATAAKNALGEIDTAIGGYVAGSAATRLMRIVNVVPR